MSSRSKRTLYVGNLPGDIREREVEDLFYKYGPIAHIELKIPPRPPGYAFVEFEEARDALDAIDGRDGYDFDGHRLRVELAHGGRGHSASTDRHSSFSGGRRGVSKHTEYRVLITGLPNSASWQDLKDHMRKAGDVCFSQVFREGGGTTGIVDYTNYEDMKNAVYFMPLFFICTRIVVDDTIIGLMSWCCRSESLMTQSSAMHSLEHMSGWVANYLFVFVMKSFIVDITSSVIPFSTCSSARRQKDNILMPEMKLDLFPLLLSSVFRLRNIKVALVPQEEGAEAAAAAVVVVVVIAGAEVQASHQRRLLAGCPLGRDLVQSLHALARGLLFQGMNHHL
ncbi:hypothetical protein KSS87_006008 [Heliosperma pusillum]|nr:hypothetical protein KSS87_006008 [Heliosperma pusillum]